MNAALTLDQMDRICALYLRNGYVVVESGLENSLLDSVRQQLAPYFGPDRSIPEHVPFSGPGRIQDAWHICTDVALIANHPPILKILKALYAKEPQAFQTLNFPIGTQQTVHSDSIHFNTFPFGAMCGVWTALEDIGRDQGPLIYYPGSHALPEMNYADLGLEAKVDNYPIYLERLQELIKNNGFSPEYGTIKKGQSLIWCANLLHGGSRRNDDSLSRHSQVTHYIMGDAQCWRPSASETKVQFFQPEKVRDMTDQPFVYPKPEPMYVRFRRGLSKTIRSLIRSSNSN